MTHTRKHNRPPVFVIVACVVCALTFGGICWNSTLRSDALPTSRDNLFLLFYEGLSLVSYLATLWYFNRLSTFRGTEIIAVLFLISVGGTVAPYVTSSVHIWATNYLELGPFLRKSAMAWLLLNVGMLVLMFVTSTVGFLLTLLFRQTTRGVAGV